MQVLEKKRKISKSDCRWTRITHYGGGAWSTLFLMDYPHYGGGGRSSVVKLTASEFKSADPGFDPMQLLGSIPGRGLRVREGFSIPPSQLSCKLVCV